MYKEAPKFHALTMATNVADFGGALSIDRWAQRHSDMLDYVMNTADMLRNFEHVGCIAFHTDFSLAKFIYPTWRITRMAKKTETKKGTMGDWKGIVAVPFGADEKREYAAQEIEFSDVALELGEIIATDYKLSLSHDNRSGAVMASLSCYNPDDPNYKSTMISRAPTVMDAIGVTVFKHVHVAERVWAESGDGDADLWG